MTPSEIACPVCGRGTLKEIDFGEQHPESQEVQTFTCGHEVKGARLETADSDRLDVERRTSDETVTPVDPGLRDDPSPLNTSQMEIEDLDQADDDQVSGHDVVEQPGKDEDQDPGHESDDAGKPQM